MKEPLYIFGVPGKVGGAATKIRHLIYLLKDVYTITVVLNHVSWMKCKDVTRFLDSQNAKYCLMRDLPTKTDAKALVICELDFFKSGRARQLKSRGMKVIFSNEMMWLFEGEEAAVKEGLVDKVLFVSDFQACSFAAIYSGVPSAIPGNYVAPEDFSFVERTNARFTLGRLSRPDMDKYPEDFPVFYEEFGIRDARFRVMAWDEKLARKYRWHRFSDAWDLLPAGKEDTERFLQSLDLFVYPLGHRVKESWGRSTVEAMLTGCIPLVPIGHQFHCLIEPGEAGYLCDSFESFRNRVLELHDDHALRRRMSRNCAEHARAALCNADQHREVWMRALSI